MGKRGHGEGSITQRKDGLWQAAVTVDGGKRKYFYAKTRREVSEKLKVALRDQQQGMLATGPSQTVAQFLTSWLQDVVKPSVRPRTYLRYEQLVRIHLIPQIGCHKLHKLTPPQLQKAYGHVGESVSPRTVERVHLCLHTALETAVRWNLIARNPADLVDPPKVERVEVRALAPYQVRAFLSAARGDPLEALYVLAVTTGLRQGELYGLKWADLDLASGIVRVRRTIGRIKGRGFVESEPKSAASRRGVILIPQAVDALKRHRVAQLESRKAAGSDWEEHDYVFCNGFGRPLEPQNVLPRSFIPLLERAGCPRIRFHDLRHSTASLLLSLGIHPRVVQEQLGHSSISLTLGTYSHTLPTLQADASKRLGDLLAQGE